METTTTNDSETGANEQHPVKIERFTRTLRVQIGSDDVAQKAQRAAHLLGERDQKTEEQKAAAKHAKAQIAEVEAELRRVSGEIRDGATYKDVSCERHFIYRLGLVREVRKDTGELLSERPMTTRETQLELGATNENGEANEAKPVATEKKKRGGGRKKKTDDEEN